MLSRSRSAPRHEMKKQEQKKKTQNRSRSALRLHSKKQEQNKKMQNRSRSPLVLRQDMKKLEKETQSRFSANENERKNAARGRARSSRFYGTAKERTPRFVSRTAKACVLVGTAVTAKTDKEMAKFGICPLQRKMPSLFI